MSKRKVFVALGVAPMLIVGLLLAVVVVAISGFSGACGAMPLDTPPGAIRVMTWNVWGDVGEQEGHPWKERAPYMVERVQTVRPDLLLMQEAGASARGPWFRDYIQEGTGLVPVGPASLGKKPRKIWINPSKLDLVSAGSWTVPMGPGPKNVLWAKLTNKETSEQFYALSVHLDYRLDKNSLRSDQTKWILDKLRAKNTTKLPVVFAGDLNTHKFRDSGNAPVTILKARGYVNTLEASSTPPVNDNMGSSLGAEGTKDLKVDERKRGSQIDYVFASKASTVHAWALIPQAPITDGKYARLTSDHNAIAVSLTLGTSTPGAPIGLASATVNSHPSSTSAPATWSSAQKSTASAIVAAGKTMGISSRGRTLAVTVALVDHQLASTSTAATFYRALGKVPGWETLTPGVAATRAGATHPASTYDAQFAPTQQRLDELAGTTTQATQFADDEPSADPCSADGLNLVWADGTDCHFENVHNPRSCQQALAEAARIARTQACRNEVRGGNWDNRCLEFVGRVYGYYAAGSYTAHDHYLLLKRKGLVKTTRDIPAGALVFFSTGQPAGHVAIYAGGGKAYSNDYIRQGCIDLTPMSTLSRGGRFLGWAPPVFPNGSKL